MSLYTFATGDRITVARINSVVYLLEGVAGGTDDIVLINGSTLNMAACAVAGGFKPPAAAGAAPTTEGVLAFNTTNHILVWGDSATNTRTAVSTNQVQTLSNKTLDNTCIITVGGVSPSSPDFWILS